MGLAWEVIRWAAEKLEPYAMNALEVAADKIARRNETASERRARRDAERQAWEEKSEWHRAEFMWNRSGYDMRDLWLQKAGIGAAWSTVSWRDLMPYHRDRLMPVISSRSS